MAISEKIQEIMTWNHINQKELNQATGISRSTLSEYIRGSRSPTVDNAQKIADALGVSLWTLLNGEPLAVTPMDLTEQECKAVGEYRLLCPEERDFIDHAFRVFNQKKKAK